METGKKNKKTINNGKALGGICKSLCEALPSAGYSGTCSCVAMASLISRLHPGEDRLDEVSPGWERKVKEKSKNLETGRGLSCRIL